MIRRVAALLGAMGLAMLGCGGSAAPEPVALSEVTLSPAGLQGGGSSTGTLTLTGPAPAGGASVALSSSHPSATPPATVTIAEGATTATFTVTTTAVTASAAATITATYSGASRTATLTLQPDPCALRTAGAQWLAFSSKRAGAYDIHAMRADGSCLTQVTNGAGDDLFATWSPAGTIAYMSPRSGRMQIYLHDLASGIERLLDVGDLTATSPAFSPDGQLVAFEGYEPGVTAISDVYVVPAAGGTPVKRTTGQKYSAGPAWSPDGITLYFVSNRVSGYNVWSVPAAGGTETMIAGTGGILGRPVATPDGTGIAYTLSAPGAAFSKVVLQTLATGIVRTVTTQADGEPTIDRTGTRMVVTSFRGGNADLWLLDVATGAEVRQLTTDPGIDGAAAFGPFP
jgi:Tol biopolymer transport system component